MRVRVPFGISYCGSALGLVLMSMLPVSSLHAQQVQVSPANRTIAVTASAEATARAEIAVINIGYKLYGGTSEDVTAQAGKTSRAIGQALTASGIAKDQIQSQSQSTGPVPPYENNEQSDVEKAQRKFEASQSWTVRVPADDAAKVLATATAAGANQNSGIEWKVQDEDALSAQAAGRALQHAKQIAQQMALGLGAKLGDLVYASNEAETIRVHPMMLQKNGAAAGLMATERTEVDQRILSLNPPMVTRSTTVSAVFAIAGEQ